MNRLDRLIMGLSPERGLRRVRARARATAIMNYDAASKGRRTYGWKSPGSAADTAAMGSRAQLRNLSRDMIRNRPWAARAQMVVAANVVGTGILPSVDSKSELVRERVSEALRLHVMTNSIDAYGEHALPGLQRIVINTVFSDGEILVRKRLRNPKFAAGLSVPFQVQLMEVDHLDHNITSHGQNRVAEGVEIGPTGQIEAYHLYNDHPGDMSWIGRRSLTSERVPAAEILHIRRADRPGQLRGVPWLAPVMMTLGELSDYQESQIMKQRMAALMAAVITSDEGAQKFGGDGLSELAPGAVIGLNPGQEIQFTTPPTVEGYGEFMKQGLAAIAMGIGITVESLSGDLKGVNFSSGRMGRMEMDRLVETWQQLLMIAQFCEGVGRWFVELMPMIDPKSRTGRALSGIRSDDFEIMWTAPRRALIDPTKEIPAMVSEIDAGLSSRQRKQRQLGNDPDVIRRERAEDQEKDAPHGFRPATEPPSRQSSGKAVGDKKPQDKKDNDDEGK